MSSNRAVYIGIDLLSNYKPFSYVALDGDCRAVAVGQGKLEETLAYLSGQQAARVAVNGPSRPNMGLVGHEEVERALFPDLPPAQWTNLRRAEVELFQRGIRVPRTPNSASDCSPWMRRGFSLYSYLIQLGFQPYPDSGDLQYLEVQAEASYWSLLGHQPYDPNSLEGRLQRQLVLHQASLPVVDPMDFFEEVTPYKLLQGQLPHQKVIQQYELNAWMGAYIAWLVDHQPARVNCLGAAEEGVVVLPIKD